MKKFLLFLAIFVFIPYACLNAQEVPLTLEEAVVIALRDNRDVLLKEEEVRKAKAKIQEAKAGLLPTLNFTGSQTFTQGLYAKDIKQTTTQATLKQYLYKGGKTVNTIRQKENEFEVSQALLDKTKLETALNLKKAFYTFLLASEFSNLNKKIFDNTLEHLDVANARYKEGQASESDVLKIKEAQSSVREAYEASLNQAEATNSLLKNLLYLENEVSIRPQGKFVYEPKEIAYTEGFLQAMKNRPEIRQYEAQGQADKRAIEVAKSDTRPSVYASWDYYSRSTTSLTFSPTKSWQDYNIYGVTFSWPIFDGWATKHKVEQAIIDLKETQLLKEKAIKDIALELKNAYLGLKNALAKMESTQAQIDLYKDALSVREKEYESGIASALDLNDASLGYEISRFNQKEAIYDYILAQASFDKATGGW